MVYKIINTKQYLDYSDKIFSFESVIAWKMKLMMGRDLICRTCYKNNIDCDLFKIQWSDKDKEKWLNRFEKDHWYLCKTCCKELLMWGDEFLNHVMENDIQYLKIKLRKRLRNANKN